MITTSKANEILKDLFGDTFYIGLSSTIPNKSGGNFTEPASPSNTPNAANGYFRAEVKALSNPVDSQTHNPEIVFFNESLGSGWGTLVAFGCFTSRINSTPFFVGSLTQPVTVPAEYIPIFRAGQLIIGLDKDNLTTP